MVSSDRSPNILEQAKAEFAAAAEKEDLLDLPVRVSTRVFRPADLRNGCGCVSPSEVSGAEGGSGPSAVTGERYLFEADVLGTRGEAFADSAVEFAGTVRDVLALPLDSDANRAILLASMNAALRHTGRLDRAVHCEDHAGRTCGEEIASLMWDRWGDVPVALVGMNPAVAESLIRTFGARNVRLADLDPAKVGTDRLGVEVRDAARDIEGIARESRIVILSGTLLATDSFDTIWTEVIRHRRFCAVYGATGAGVCSLLGMNFMCPNARNN